MGLRFYISAKFLSDADAASLQPTLWVTKLYDMNWSGSFLGSISKKHLILWQENSLVTLFCL